MLQSMESQRAGHNLVTEQQQHSNLHTFSSLSVYLFSFKIFLLFKIKSQVFIFIPNKITLSSVQFSSLSRVQLFATPMNHSTPGLPVLH